MNKLLSLFIPVLAPVALAAQGNNFTITGHLQQVEAPMVYIYYNGTTLTDSARVVDHTYTISGKITNGLPGLLRIGSATSTPYAAGMLPVFLSPESFTITHKGSFANAVITGSPANEQFKKLNALQKAFMAATDSLGTVIEKAQYAGDALAEATAQQQLNELAANKQDLVYGRFLLENPGSVASVYAFNRYIQAKPQFDVEKTKPLFATLPDSIRNATSGLAFQKRMESVVTFDKTVVEGKDAPDFEQNDTAGNPVKLSSFRGKYVLLDFWASWCGPCRAENPAVVKAYSKFHDKGFEILGVSLDQPGARDKWLKAIHDDKLPWTHVSDLQYWNNAAVKLYGVQGIPQNFLIDPQGKIVARSLRGADLEKKLGEIYSN
jgi:peroxiredoxin